MANIKVIETEDEFFALKPKWDELVAKNSQARVFQTFDWCSVIWKHYILEGRLQIIYINREGHKDEEAIFPFWIDLKNNLRFIGDEISDECDVVCADHHTIWFSLYNEVAEFIRLRGYILSLSHLPESSELLRYWRVLLPDTTVTYVDSYSILDLKKNISIEKACFHLTSRERSRVTALKKRVLNHTFLVYQHDLHPFPLKELESLREDMIKKGLRTNSFFDSRFVRIMKEIYLLGMCEIATLSSNGKFELAAFRLLRSKIINFWVVLYRDGRLLSPLYAFYMDEKIIKGDTIFDYGTGAYSYKLMTFRPDVHHLYSLTTYQPSLKTFLKEEILLLRKYLKLFAQKIKILPLLSRLHLVKNKYH